jgi:hypothetical protein
MAKFCTCGSPTCPICNPKRGKTPETANVRRNKRETPNIPRAFSPPAVVPDLITKVHAREGYRRRGAALGADMDAPREPCGECGRPYCPECGEPIPVRGAYCKPACRSRAWRKRKT